MTVSTSITNPALSPAQPRPSASSTPVEAGTVEPREQFVASGSPLPAVMSCRSPWTPTAPSSQDAPATGVAASQASAEETASTSQGGWARWAALSLSIATTVGGVMPGLCAAAPPALSAIASTATAGIEGQAREHGMSQRVLREIERTSGSESVQQVVDWTGRVYAELPPAAREGVFGTINHSGSAMITAETRRDMFVTGHLLNENPFDGYKRLLQDDVNAGRTTKEDAGRYSALLDELDHMTPAQREGVLEVFNHLHIQATGASLQAFVPELPPDVKPASSPVDEQAVLKEARRLGISDELAGRITSTSGPASLDNTIRVTRAFYRQATPAHRRLVHDVANGLRKNPVDGQVRGADAWIAGRDGDRNLLAELDYALPSAAAGPLSVDQRIRLSSYIQFLHSSTPDQREAMLQVFNTLYEQPAATHGTAR